MDLNFDSYKLLMVGAGGIGCELLKNLVLTGFNQIEVVIFSSISISTKRNFKFLIYLKTQDRFGHDRVK